MFQYSLTGKKGSGSGFGSWKTVPAVPVPLSVSGKTVPTVPVSGSGSVPEPPCFFLVLTQARAAKGPHRGKLPKPLRFISGRVIPGPRAHFPLFSQGSPRNRRGGESCGTAKPPPK